MVSNNTENAFDQIEVTDEGIEFWFNEGQFKNSSDPINATDEEIVI